MASGQQRYGILILYIKTLLNSGDKQLRSR
jgi:hypothetical protein